MPSGYNHVNCDFGELWVKMVGRGSSAAADDDDWDGDPLAEGDPLASLVDRIAAVKTSFTNFSSSLKGDGFGLDDEGDDERDFDNQDIEESIDPAEDMEAKINRFESLLGRLSDVVSQMESVEQELGAERDGGLDEEAEDDLDDEDDLLSQEFAAAGNNPIVSEYEALIRDLLVPFLEAVNAIGGEVQKQGAYVAQAFGAQREMLTKVAEQRQPEQEHDLMRMLEGTMEALACIDQINEDADHLRKHTAMVAGAMTCFGWVTSPDPRQYIGDMLNAVPVYGRQILEEFRGEEHGQLVSTLKYLLRGLQEYVAKHHAQGLAWNGRHSPNKGQSKQAARPNMVRDREAKVDHLAMLAAYDDTVMAKVEDFVGAAEALPFPTVRKQAVWVDKCFKAQREFLQTVATCKRPADEDISQLLTETSEALMEIEALCDNAGRDRLHLTLVSSGMPCLAWVSALNMQPTAYISDMINSIPVYGEKIVAEVSGTEDAESHRTFVSTFRDMLRGLNDYVRTHHAKGLNWNMDGVDFDEIREEVSEDWANTSAGPSGQVSPPPSN